jgi:hypothetical protein
MKEETKKMNETDELFRFLSCSLLHSDRYGAMVQRVNTGKSAADESVEVRDHADYEDSTFVGYTEYRYYATTEMIDGNWHFCEHFFAGNVEVKKEDYELLLKMLFSTYNR